MPMQPAKLLYDTFHALDMARRRRRRIRRGREVFLAHLRGVIHVGPNLGQERKLYRDYGLNVLWIEPIPGIFAELQSRIATFHPNQQAVQALVTDEDDKPYEGWTAVEGSLYRACLALHPVAICSRFEHEVGRALSINGQDFLHLTSRRANVGALKKLRRIIRHQKGQSVRDWLRRGRPVPPPHAIKARNLLTCADLFGTDVLVETGTYRGGMIAATLDRFDRIYSIELDPKRVARARKRFRPYSERVVIIEGDSGRILPDLLKRDLPDRVLFWLDGHYSGHGTARGEVDTPIMAELKAIATLRRGKADVIMIDDAREFGRGRDYPSVDEMQDFILRTFGREAVIADDAFFILPIRPPDPPSPPAAESDEPEKASAGL